MKQAIVCVLGILFDVKYYSVEIKDMFSTGDSPDNIEITIENICLDGGGGYTLVDVLSDYVKDRITNKVREIEAKNV